MTGFGSRQGHICVLEMNEGLMGLRVIKLCQILNFWVNYRFKSELFELFIWFDRVHWGTWQSSMHRSVSESGLAEIIRFARQFRLTRHNEHDANQLPNQNPAQYCIQTLHCFHVNVLKL